MNADHNIYVKVKLDFSYRCSIPHRNELICDMNCTFFLVRGICLTFYKIWFESIPVGFAGQATNLFTIEKSVFMIFHQPVFPTREEGLERSKTDNIKGL